MHFLNFNYLHERGDIKGLGRINEDDDSVRAVAIMWLDKNHQFFVGNSEPATTEEPLYHVRWRQVAEQSDHLETELVENAPKMPVMIEAYYSASGAIDRQNKQRQDDLEIERELRTKDWWKQVNTSIFGMIIVDAVNVHQACAGPEDIEDYQNEWFTSLVRELIDNAVK